MDYRGLEKCGRDKPSVYIFKKTLNNYGSCQFTLNLQNDHFTFRAINLFFPLGVRVRTYFLVIETRDSFKRLEISTFGHLRVLGFDPSSMLF